jgi:putative ABC transport system ATP-binding protein
MPDADADAAPVVTLRDVARAFEGPPLVEAIRGVDLEIARGDYVSIVGPSGSGKSTLLSVLGLLDRPTRGTYALDSIETTTLRDRERARLRAGRIGFVFQAFHLLADRTVLENVMLAMLYGATPRRERAERARSAIERVGLAHRIDASPRTLSGGELQRAAIARAVVTAPSLLLADEPTGNLDRASSDGVLDLFDEMHADGLTVVVITHDETVSARARRRVRVVDGRAEMVPC